MRSCLVLEPLKKLRIKAILILPSLLKTVKSIFDDLEKYSEMLENFAKIFSTTEDKIDLTDLNNANIL